jgi:hypothetical protein
MQSLVIKFSLASMAASTAFAPVTFSNTWTMASSSSSAPYYNIKERAWQISAGRECVELAKVMSSISNSYY